MRLIILTMAIILAGCTNSQQVAQGVTEILVIAYQPGTQAANAVAHSKDQTEAHIRHLGGTSRLGRTVASQVTPAARDAVGNSSNNILVILTGGIIDIYNIDHH